MKVQKDDWGNWFAGFSDGEGCFIIGKFKGKKHSWAQYYCRFVIGLRHDDRPILDDIRGILGIGRLFYSSNDRSNSSNDRSNSQPSIKFQVSDRKECAEIVDLFEKYPLRAKKQNDFAIWKLAVAELQKTRGERDADLLEYYFRKIREIRKCEVQEELPKPEIKSLQLTIEFK